MQEDNFVVDGQGRKIGVFVGPYQYQRLLHPEDYEGDVLFGNSRHSTENSFQVDPTISKLMEKYTNNVN